jgi:hypothetical protein
MATMNNEFIFKQHTRPCWVDGRRAIFHRWTDSARPVKPRGMEEDETADRFQIHSVHALVEYEDGTVERVWPNTVRFADSKELFDGLAWEQMEARRDTEDGMSTTLPAEETQEENGQAISEINPHCMTCAHGGDNAEFCEGAGYDCDKCTIIRCICKRCTDCNQWEPKGGAAW